MARSSDKSADRPKRWIGLKQSSFRAPARGFMSDAEYTVKEYLRHLICGRRSDGSTSQLFRFHSAYCVDMSTKSLRGRQSGHYTVHEGSFIQILVSSIPTSVTEADSVVLLTPSMERGDRTFWVVHSLNGDKSATTIYAHISKMIPCTSTDTFERVFKKPTLEQAPYFVVPLTENMRRVLALHDCVSTTEVDCFPENGGEALSHCDDVHDSRWTLMGTGEGFPTHSR